jgi:hypothetical protein
MKPRVLRIVFWVALVGLVGWDWRHSAPVNIRLEPPLLAAGSGQTATAGHCALVK